MNLSNNLIGYRIGNLIKRAIVSSTDRNLHIVLDEQTKEKTVINNTDIVWINRG